jgi:signal peptidase II
MFNRRYTLLVVTAIFLDQLTKWWAVHALNRFDSWVLVPKVLEFQLVFNTGAAYGLFLNQRVFLSIVAGLVIVGAIWFQRYFNHSIFSRLGICFVLAGAWGNWIDRLRLGYVVDFINIHIFPVFNVADMCIDLGLALLLADLIWGHRGANQKS